MFLELAYFVLYLCLFYCFIFIPIFCQLRIYRSLRSSPFYFSFSHLHHYREELLIEHYPGLIFYGSICWVLILIDDSTIHHRPTFYRFLRVSRARIWQFVKMASQEIQEAYQVAADQFGDSCSSIAQAIEMSRQRGWESKPDECHKAITTLLKKDFIYATRSVRRLLSFSSIPSAVIGHFDTKFTLAVNTAESTKPSISTIALTPAVSEYLSSAKTRKAKYMVSVNNSMRSIVAKAPPVLVRIDVLALKTQALVSRSNAGVTLALALDGRAKKPEAAILGGHLQFSKDDQISTSLFFPRLTFSSAESDLDRCVQVWTTAQGYGLNDGIASVTSTSMVGEVTADVGSTSMLAPMRAQLERVARQTMSDGALPIHPYVAKENNVDEVVMEWSGASSSLQYKGSTAGISEWSPAADSGSKSLRFGGLKGLQGPRAEESLFHRNPDDDHERDPRERQRLPNRNPTSQQSFYEQGEGDIFTPIVIPKENFAWGPEDTVSQDTKIASYTVDVPGVSAELTVLEVIKLFDNLDLSSSSNPEILKLHTASILIPKLFFRVRFSLPAAYSCPIIVSWDEARCMGDTYTLEEILHLPFMIVAPTSNASYSTFAIDTFGRSGMYSCSRALSQEVGVLYVSCMAHDFAGLIGKAQIHVEVWVGKGSIASSGHDNQAPPQKPTLCTLLLDKPPLCNIKGNTFLGALQLVPDMDTSKFYQILVKPGVGAVGGDGRTVQGSNISAFCSNWAFWTGTAQLSVDITARASVAGQLSIYTVPTSFEVSKLTREMCVNWPREVVTFNGRDRKSVV